MKMRKKQFARDGLMTGLFFLDSGVFPKNIAGLFLYCKIMSEDADLLLSGIIRRSKLGRLGKTRLVDGRDEKFFRGYTVKPLKKPRFRDLFNELPDRSFSRGCTVMQKLYCCQIFNWEMKNETGI
ncbi:MAG: hypothetical protein HY579_05510 [Nitrospinae bacterium]|nr:hypothetical protein [Nitrospinota bacterium]